VPSELPDIDVVPLLQDDMRLDPLLLHIPVAQLSGTPV